MPFPDQVNHDDRDGDHDEISVRGKIEIPSDESSYQTKNAEEKQKQHKPIAPLAFWSTLIRMDPLIDRSRLSSRNDLDVEISPDN